jgi:hypothetical protein
MACENDKEDKCCKKIVKKVAAPRRLGANAIPEEILLNKSLNDAIAATLPKNYNFVLDLKINKSNTVDTNRFSRFYSHFIYCKLFSISR